MAEPSSSGPPSNLPAVALTEAAIRERFAPSDVRKKQIRALVAQIGRSNRPPIWAALTTCDERRLKILRAKCDCDPMFRTIFGAFSSSIAEAVMAWVQIPNAPISRSASPPPSKKHKTEGSEPYRTSASDQAKKRDRHRCVLTGTYGIVEAAHIYPRSMHFADAPPQTIALREVLWRIIEIFQLREVASAWKKELFENDGITPKADHCRNILTLAASPHAAWNTGLFVLEPIDIVDEGHTLNIRIWFLGDGPDVASSQLMSLITEPATTLPHNGRLPMTYAEQEEGDNWYTPPYAGGSPLLSGQMIPIHSDDPEKLPSFLILEMQLFMTRLARLSGVAKLED